MLKKSIAVLTAVAAIASASSVFAADYKDQVVSLTDTEKAALTDATAQYTVIIAPKATANGTSTQSTDGDSTATTVTLSADKLLYINQGTSAETFWTNMGTKTALADGEYIIRIGSNKSGFGEDGKTYVEMDLTVKTDQGTEDKKTLTFKWGDITLDGSIDISDALAALYYGSDICKSYTNASDETYTIGTTYGDFKWGDITLDGSIDISDALAALYYGSDICKSYTTEAGTTYTVGTEYTITVE